MGALMDLRIFKMCLLVASILLMFLAAGVIVFGTRLEIVRANAVAVLSVIVWLGCAVSVIHRWFCSKRPYKAFGSKADRTRTYETALSGGPWMLNPSPARLPGRIATEFHFNRLISDPSDSTVYGVVLIRTLRKSSTADVSTDPQ
jgi:hypothetical protein